MTMINVLCYNNSSLQSIATAIDKLRKVDQLNNSRTESNLMLKIQEEKNLYAFFYLSQLFKV